MIVLWPPFTLATAAVTASDPDPYDLPSGTDAIEVSGEGYIRSATQSTDNGSEPADIRALGHVRVDGDWRAPGASIEWDDLVELGAIENAGSGKATISFESGFIIDLGPDEVLFVNNLLDEETLADDLVVVAGCTCECECQVPGWCCGSPTGGCSTSWSCSETNYMCAEFTGDLCTVGDGTNPNCSDTMICRRRWQWN